MSQPNNPNAVFRTECLFSASPRTAFAAFEQPDRLRWEETMRGLLESGCERFYEIGPGRVLAGLLKRVHRKADCRNV